MYLETQWLVFQENIRNNRRRGETPTAIITPRSTILSYAFCIKSAYLGDDDDYSTYRWGVPER